MWKVTSLSKSSSDNFPYRKDKHPDAEMHHWIANWRSVRPKRDRTVTHSRRFC
jgi:hypothetical protein